MFKGLSGLLIAAVCAAIGAVQAQGFPSTPVRIVVPYSAGGTTDLMTREVARSPGDGYTVLFSQNGPSSTAPVSLVSTASLFVVVNAAVPSNDLKSFIDYARTQSNGLEYASAGIKMIHIPYKGLAPTGTPANVVARLNDAISKAVALPDLQQRFVNFGVIAAAGSPKHLGDLIANEVPRWAQIVREANIHAE